ncbi:response regulator transcription factor [Calothrix rhizosoleniae]|uniref:response regulator transcription factor n=1 Tax=Calothrix rhizosoleniae TaxID=888997 RepID=UPI000B4A1449|nr:response regulator transcription factor [Calothrix rhizosoleniae]
MIRLLLVDDQRIIRQGIKSLLESQADFDVIGEAENGQQAINQIEVLQPDLVLMDVRMPIMDGVAATQIICQKFPQIKILILTTFDDDEYVSQAIRFGAKGYLLKDTSMDPLANAIRLIHAGHTHLGPGLIEKVIAHISDVYPTKNSLVPPELAELTPREKEVLHLIAKGANNKEIAKTLFIAERTVKNHVTSILTRLNLRDRTQAAIFAHSFLSVFDNNL